ncbi:tryptophan--tRNA ligase [Goodfellowiella coeruleoviolacea]|uniref:Tryptophan--tRNA ligase n=1 Tax=Goodfellowiella coeruleoviolacea TaxID=334858 RepID=A0AAE3KK00_9PSEU|nr:tryptophan--tRNA ligase [Goodfellowiella coeruleoviolacea]MCP2169657.1 tryptophanyl-tRNA synthetase [Goodfellowiella coeruleoviolacea]
MIRLSGITPSAEMHLGNYLGAVRRWASESGPDDLYFVSDLHAMTLPHDPTRLRELTNHQLAVLVAAGVPAESLFVQSDVLREHGGLTWLLECTCTFGEARRMIQFKEKSAGRDSVRLSLLTYPVLMAADILLHGAHQVPVGEDQGQHVELARTLARRFNSSYGEAFVVPEAVLPTAAARVRDLTDPSRKMSKSAANPGGVVFVLDDPDVVRRKIRRAVTDALGVVRHAPDEQPGVANLLEIQAACVDSTPERVAEGITSYRQLKESTAEAVVERLRPVRARALELLADLGELGRVRAAGAERARRRSGARLDLAARLAGVG